MSPPPSPIKKKQQSRVAPRLPSPFIAPYYTIQPIPDKGQGIVALRKIDALSTILMEETPILAIPSTMDENDSTALTIWLEEYLRTLSPELADEKRKATMELANAHPEKPGLSGILLTNGFQLPAKEDWPSCRGLFLTISRINHACEPNCAQRWNAEKGKMSIVPVKDIEVGAEITLTYLPLEACQTVWQRIAWLMNDFEFWCKCELCVSEGGDKYKAITREGEVVIGGETEADLAVESGAKVDATAKEHEEKLDAGNEKPKWDYRW